MKAPKVKIKVSDICAALNECGLKVSDKRSFYRCNGLGVEYVSLVPARGQTYKDEITSFTLFVGSTYRRLGDDGYHHEKVEGPDWRGQLTEAARTILTKQAEYARIEEARRHHDTTALYARRAYGKALSPYVGKDLEEWHVLHDVNKMPVGYTLKLDLTGTAEEVGKKIQAIMALAKA